LIVLRKALGADVGEAMAKKSEELSALRFRPQDPATSGASALAGRFRTQLIQTIGGPTVDIALLESESHEQPSIPVDQNHQSATEKVE
jgi:hypothetical protein